MLPRLPTFLRTLACVSSLVFPSTATAQCLSGANSALQFDGTDWVRIAGGGTAALDGFQDFTIEAWYRLDPGANDVALLSKSHPSSPISYCIRVSGSGGTFFFGTPGGGFGAYPFTLPAVAAGVWRHLALTRSGTTLTVYSNGQSVATTTSVPGALLSSNAMLTLGVQANNNSNASLFQFLRGGLDEVRIFAVARSAAEIQASRTSVLSGNEPGLVGYWTLDEATGQTLTNRATATAGTLGGTRGVDGSAGPDDPAWNVSSPAPISFCAPGTGQANSLAASLRINGVGPAGVRGPFRVQIPSAGPMANRITLSWSGPPGAPLVLGAGTLRANAAVIPCVGSLDLAPGFAVVGDFVSTPFPLNYMFILDGSGRAELSFTVPSAVLGGGPWVTLQGAVTAPSCGIPAILTAAFELR